MVGSKVFIKIPAILAVSERLNIQYSDARKLLEDARMNHRFNETSSAQEQIYAALEVWKGIPEAFQKDIVAKQKNKKNKPVHPQGHETKGGMAKKRTLRDPDPCPVLAQSLVIVRRIVGGKKLESQSLATFFIPPTILEGPYAQDVVLAIGDSMFKFYEDLDNADVGVDFFMAREMARAVQFSMSLEDAKGDIDQVVQTIIKNPDRLNRGLEADAMATFSMILAQNYTIKSLPEVVEAADALGDRVTAFFGTPEQRSCAVRWAADEALNDQKISPREFRALFHNQYTRIQEIDPSTCAFEGTPDMLQQLECGSTQKLPPTSSSLQTEIWISRCVIFIATLGLFI